jgi:hypothetical protein
MQSWVARDAAKAQAGEEMASRSASQRLEWPLPDQQRAGRERAECDDKESA